MKQIKTILTAILLLNCINIAVADTLYDQRFKRWQKEAAQGKARSQYALGNAYLRGNEVKIDTKKAIEWFEAAAKQGHSKSEYKLGYLYYTGKGVKRNYKQAANWFRKAAANDYSPAQFYLGKCYMEGHGVDRDYNKALEWLQKSKQNGYTPASRQLAAVKEAIKASKNQTTPAAKVQPKSETKKIAKAKSKKKTAAGLNKNDILNLLQNSDWKFSGKPAENMPSSLTNCKIDGKNLACKTREINITNPFADITYVVESKFSHFSNQKSLFKVVFRRNNISVIPTDPDDPEPNPEDIPAVGMTDSTIMKCKVVSTTKIKCFTDNYKRVTYER